LSKNKRNTRRKIRSLKSKYLFFKSSLDEIQSLLLEYESEWDSDRSFILKYFSNYGHSESGKTGENSSICHSSVDFNSEKYFESSADNHPKLKNNDILPKDEAPPWAKKLYKQIALRTHPDTLGESSDKEHLSSIFQKAASIMKDGDYSALVDICMDLNISIESSDNYFIKILTDRIKNLRHKILKIEESPSWLWGESFGITDIRIEMIKSLLKNYKLELPDDDIIKEIVDKIEN